MCIYIYIYTCVYVCIYIYIYRERETSTTRRARRGPHLEAPCFLSGRSDRKAAREVAEAAGQGRQLRLASAAQHSSQTPARRPNSCCALITKS